MPGWGTKRNASTGFVVPTGEHKIQNEGGDLAWIRLQYLLAWVWTGFEVCQLAPGPTGTQKRQSECRTGWSESRHLMNYAGSGYGARQGRARIEHPMVRAETVVGMSGKAAVSARTGGEPS